MNQESSENLSENYAPGALLKQARINAEFSSDDVATRMNLTVEIIEAIDADSYDDKISPAFYRGYLRTYAQLVLVDADEIIELYNKLINKDSLEVSITPTFDTNLYTKKERNYPYFKWILYFFITIIVVYAAFFIWNKKLNSDDNEINQITINSSTIDNQAEIPLTGLSDDIATPAPEEHTQANSLPVLESSNSPARTQQQAETPAVPENAILVMDFKGDCWVKVVDSTGEVLALGIKRTGKHMQLEGMAPFNLILGNAAVVSIEFNQRAVDLSGFPAGNRVELQISSDSELLQ